MLSGSALITIYIFGIFGTIWFRTIFAAPAFFAIFNYIVFWFGWNRALTNVDLLHFQITYQICLWLGVLVGISTSLVMRFPVLCGWPYRHNHLILLRNGVVLCAVMGVQTTYNILRYRFTPWYGFITLISLVALYPCVYALLRRDRDRVFNTDKRFNVFFFVIASMHVISLVAFFSVDAIIDANTDLTNGIGIYLRVGILVALTLVSVFVLIILKLVHPHGDNKEQHWLSDSEMDVIPDGESDSGDNGSDDSDDNLRTKGSKPGHNSSNMELDDDNEKESFFPQTC